MTQTQNKPVPQTPPPSTAKPVPAPKPAPKTYHGKSISTTRDAIKGDPGFNGTDGQQAVIKTASGQEKTVLHTELSAG